MRMFERPLEVLAVVAALAFQSVPLQAQPFDQTFVRSDGGAATSCENLANRCSPLALGVQNVSAGGTVNVLDSNVHVAVQIGVGITILAVGGENIVAQSGIGSPSSGIHVNTASSPERTTIRGIGIDQGGTSNHGVSFVGSGKLLLENCFIRGSFNGFGINFTPNDDSELHISNCVIAANGTGASGGGILIRPTGAASVKVVLDNVRIEDNLFGIQVIGNNTSGTNIVTVRNSTIAGNAGYGLYAADAGGGTTNVTIEGSSWVNNGAQGAVAVGSTATVRMRDSTVTGNVEGIQAALGANFISHGGNVVAGNQFNNGAFTQTLPPQ